MTQQTIAVAASVLTAGTTTIATLSEVDNLPLEHTDKLSIRLEVTTPMIGDTPTMDIFIQRTQDDPGADDWDDWFAFPQVTTSAVDLVVHGPLPLPQDADGSLASASHAVIQEALAADTLLAGLIGHKLRIREKITTSGTITTAAIYNIHLVAKG